MTDPTIPLSDIEKVAALDTYLKAIKTINDKLRASVEKQMGDNHDERKGAVLADGTKLASITRSDGSKKARVTDEQELLFWARLRHPEQVYTIEAVRPAFIDALLTAAKGGEVGEPGFDPSTGEILDFIEVVQGNPYITITATKEGKARMQALADGFPLALEAPENPSYGAGPGEGR